MGDLKTGGVQRRLFDDDVMFLFAEVYLQY